MARSPTLLHLAKNSVFGKALKWRYNKYLKRGKYCKPVTIWIICITINFCKRTMHMLMWHNNKACLYSFFWYQLEIHWTALKTQLCFKLKKSKLKLLNFHEIYVTHASISWKEFLQISCENVDCASNGSNFCEAPQKLEFTTLLLVKKMLV